MFGSYSWDSNVAFPEWTDSMFDDVEWTGWVADQGEHPSDCLRQDQPNGQTVTDLVNVVTYGAADEADPVDGKVTNGAIHDGGTTDGAITDGATDYSAPVVSVGTPTAVPGAIVKVSVIGPDSKGVISTKLLG